MSVAAAPLHPCLSPSPASLRAPDAFAAALLGPEGAVWTRAYISLPSQSVCDKVAAVARAMRVSRVVVGHTVMMDGRVSVR
eukprot:363824-Chlamydomonas_euryale.AAC.11